MTGKTHIAIGMATGLTIAFNQPLENQLIIVLASVMGSLFPDLDHPKGKLNQKILLFNNDFYKSFFYLSLGGVFLCLYFKISNNLIAALGVMSIFLSISSHRGFTHSIVGFLVSTYIIEIISINYNNPAIYSGFITGYILHLIADFFTPKGIKLFYPLKTNVCFPFTIKTNGKFEKGIFLFLSIYCLCLLFRYIKI